MNLANIIISTSISTSVIGMLANMTPFAAVSILVIGVFIGYALASKDRA